MKKLLSSALLLYIAALAVCFQACKKDDERISFLLDEPALFFTETGTTLSVGFSGQNIATVAVSTKPEGWSIDVNMEQRRIYVTAPASLPSGKSAETDTKENEASGTILLASRSHGGSPLTATLYVSLAELVDYTERPANCYIVNQKNKLYRIDATAKGERSGQIEPASAAIVWSTSKQMIRYIRLDGNDLEFFYSTETGAESENPIEGNAVVGVYDSDGALLWSWHLWCTGYDPDTDAVRLNGAETMTRNLGAFASSGESTDAIQKSYGLYYQWGRKDPFIGPLYYDVAGGRTVTMYDSEERIVLVKTTASTAETGTTAYAAAHPLCFITGVESTGFNWMQRPDPSLWGNTKTENDPCPRGWKVPSAADYAALLPEGWTTRSRIYENGNVGDLSKTYGYVLTDGTDSMFFPGAGRRSFHTGDITNMNSDEMRPTPWIGYYWTSDFPSEAMTFSYNKIDDRRSEGTFGIAAQHAAGGMQVRCVRVK